MGSGWTGYGGHGEDVAGRRWWCKGGARDKGRLWGKDWRGAGTGNVSYDYPHRQRKTEGNADGGVRGVRRYSACPGEYVSVASK